MHRLNSLRRYSEKRMEEYNMLNRIVIMGRLTRDPELRYTTSRVPVCSFSIACDRDYKPENGERETDFVDVVAWRNIGEFVSKYFKKGRVAVIEGRLQIREWNDKEGTKRRTAEIVADNVYFGDSKTEDKNTAGTSEELRLPEGFMPDI